MIALPPWAPAGTPEHRSYFREYMRLYRAGRRLRHRRQPMVRPRFLRPGFCSSCFHRWPFGDRCPLCALEASGRASVEPERWAAWAALMEVLL